MMTITLGEGCGVKATLLTPSGSICDLRRARHIAATLVYPGGQTLDCDDVSYSDITNSVYVRLLNGRELTAVGRYGILFNVQLDDRTMYSTPLTYFLEVTAGDAIGFNELYIALGLTVTDFPDNVAYTGASPKISARNTWLVYNDALGGYVDTGIHIQVGEIGSGPLMLRAATAGGDALVIMPPEGSESRTSACILFGDGELNLGRVTFENEAMILKSVASSAALGIKGTQPIYRPNALGTEYTLLHEGNFWGLIDLDDFIDNKGGTIEGELIIQDGSLRLSGSDATFSGNNFSASATTFLTLTGGNVSIIGNSKLSLTSSADMVFKAGTMQFDGRAQFSSSTDIVASFKPRLANSALIEVGYAEGGNTFQAGLSLGFAGVLYGGAMLGISVGSERTPIYYNGSTYTLLHTGNYADYIGDLDEFLKVSGGVISGDLSVEGKFDVIGQAKFEDLAVERLSGGSAVLRGPIRVERTSDPVSDGKMLQLSNPGAESMAAFLSNGAQCAVGIISGAPRLKNLTTGDSIGVNHGEPVFAQGIDDYIERIILHQGNYESFIYTSDERAKNIIDDAYIDIADIAAAPCKIFTYKRDGKLSAGSLAQYWLGIRPELVGEDKLGTLFMRDDRLALLSVISVARVVTDIQHEISEMKKQLNAA